MKTIKGFEGEEIAVSDFGEWVGKDYIDYKFEYKNNQKVIKELFKENQELKKQLEEKENQQKKFIEYLEEKISMCDGFIDTIKNDLEEVSYVGRASGKTYIATQIMKNETARKCYEEILKKYKEITGGKGGEN